MISPIPFWPSFEPWAKLTPVQVSDQQGANPERRRLPFGSGVEFLVRDQMFAGNQQQRRRYKSHDRRETKVIFRYW